MIIYICDSCKVEKNHLETIGIPCHLYSMRDKGQYVDNEFNAVSGRNDIIHLCNKCKNEFYIAGLQTLGLTKK